MLKGKIYYLVILFATVFGLYSCGGSSDDDTEVTAPFSLGISDAPFDTADAVFIEIDKITLTSADGTITEINDFDGDSSIGINLMDYQGADQVMIINESQGIELPLGPAEMELTIIDAGSYVLLTGDTQEYPIKVPSSRLRLGEFNVTLGAVQVENVPGFTIEFDLRRSLVQRGNDPAKNGFIIKPHGVRITSSASSGTIAGNVDMAAFMAAEADSACGNVDSFVYLYAGDVLASEDMLIDMVDDAYAGEPAIPEGSIKPFASTAITLNADNSYSYEFGFVPNGDSFLGEPDVDAATYTVAFVCGTGITDTAENYEELLIANPSGQLGVVTVITGETAMLDFPLDSL